MTKSFDRAMFKKLQSSDIISGRDRKWVTPLTLAFSEPKLYRHQSRGDGDQ